MNKQKTIIFQKSLKVQKAKILAPFSERYKKIASLHALPSELHSVVGNCISFNKGNAIFVKNHKAACSTISHLIYKHECGHDYVEENIHHEYTRLVQGLPNFPAVVNTLMNPASFKFTFVRDPVSRSVSAFKNIFLDRSNDAWLRHRDAIREFNFHDSDPLEKQFNVFLDYVSESIRQEPYLTDPHFRRQIDNIGIEHINFDFVGRVENIRADLNKISHVLPCISEVHSDGKKIRSVNKSKVQYNPNSKQISRIKDMYRYDYERFSFL